MTLNGYLQRLDLSSKAPAAAPNAVQCITVHRAKGLEFQHVYLIGMAQEVFLSYRAPEGTAEQGGGRGAAELFRGDHPGPGDADVDAGA